MIENPKYKDNVIVKLSFEFALTIIEFSEKLEKRRKYNLGNQLFRSGTSIGANIIEAQNAESNADFIHKLKIAAKEADETEYWLLLCKYSKSYPDADEILKKLQPVSKILTKIIATSKKSKTIKK
jgi:four helix bundle protein